MAELIEAFQANPWWYGFWFVFVVFAGATVVGAMCNWPRWYIDGVRRLMGLRPLHESVDRESAPASTASTAMHDTFESKLAEIIALNGRVTELTLEARAELDLKVAAAEQLLEDAKHSQAIASLTVDQRRAAERMVAVQVDAAFSRNSRGERRFQIWLSAFGFIAGVLATVVTTLMFAAFGVGE